MNKKIRNTSKSWEKHLGERISLWEENSAWDGGPEWIETYVVKTTPKGVWFSNDVNCCNDFLFWIPFKKLEGYTK